MENNAIIKTNDLCKSFEINKIGQKVLKNINLEIYRNDFTVIMGPSGAGKSTLLYALSDEAHVLYSLPSNLTLVSSIFAFLKLSIFFSQIVEI